jgi:hypothetical protein
MTPQEQAVLADDAKREAAIVREAQPARLDMEAIVRDVFDDVEWEYVNVTDELRDWQQTAALYMVETEVMQHFPEYRRFNKSESVKIGILVASEWQRRRAKAEESAFDHAQGKLWSQHEGDFAENY